MKSIYLLDTNIISEPSKPAPNKNVVDKILAILNIHAFPQLSGQKYCLA